MKLEELNTIKENFIKDKANKTSWVRNFGSNFFWFETPKAYVLSGYLPALIVEKKESPK